MTESHIDQSPITSIKKPLPIYKNYIFHTENTSPLKINFGQRAHFKLCVHSSSEENKKYHNIIHIGENKDFSSEDNPYKFKSLVISRKRILFDGETYILGFDDLGNIYIFDGKKLRAMQDIFNKTIINAPKKEIIDDIFKLLKETNIIGNNIEDNPNFKAKIEKYIRDEDYYFRMLKAK